MSSDKILREEQIWNNVYNKNQKTINVTTKQLVQGKDYDLITATYPNSTTEVYTYSLLGNTVLTATVVYTSSSKRDILTVSFV